MAKSASRAASCECPTVWRDSSALSVDSMTATATEATDTQTPTNLIAATCVPNVRQATFARESANQHYLPLYCYAV